MNSTEGPREVQVGSNGVRISDDHGINVSTSPVEPWLPVATVGMILALYLLFISSLSPKVFSIILIVRIQTEASVNISVQGIQLGFSLQK